VLWDVKRDGDGRVDVRRQAAHEANERLHTARRSADNDDIASRHAYSAPREVGHAGKRRTSTHPIGISFVLR
jgi:hypothetical protein